MTPPRTAGVSRSGLASLAGLASRASLALLAAAVATAAAAAPALAEPVSVVPPEEHATFPRIAIDGAGETTVAWKTSTRPYRVRAALRTPASPAFGAPFTLAPGHDEATLAALAAGPRGETAIAWFDGALLSATDYWLQLRPAGASAFGAPIRISSQGAGESLGQAGISLAIDARGTVTASWVTVSPFPGLRSRLQAAALAAGATAFSSPVDVAPTGPVVRELDTAVDADGGVTAVWTRDNGARNVVQAAHQDAGQTGWSTPQDLSDDGAGAAGGTASDVHVAAGPAGSATAAWAELIGGPHQVVQAARRAAGAPSFGATQTLSSLDPRDDAQKARVAVDANGEAIVAWELDNPSIVIGSPPLLTAAAVLPDRIETAWSGAGAASFAPAVGASDPAVDALQPALAASPKGGFVLTYAEEPRNLVKLRTRGAGEASTWGVARTVAPAFGAQLAVAPDGDASLLWQEDGVPKVESLDTTPPLPDGLTVPASAVVGQQLAMSVAPRDRLSPLDRTTWSFGDGASATGDAVAHAYAAPGRQRVAVTVSDLVGNAVTVTRDVTVTPVPVDGAPGGPGASGGPAGGGGARRRALPRITKASLSPRRLRPARRGGPLISRRVGRTGARLRFTVSEPGSVALALARVTPGRRGARARGRRCSATARGGRRCTLVTPLARAVRRVRRGTVALVLSGRARGRALSPGRYRLQLRLTTAAGARSAVTTLPLTVVR